MHGRAPLHFEEPTGQQLVAGARQRNHVAREGSIVHFTAESASRLSRQCAAIMMGPLRDLPALTLHDGALFRQLLLLFLFDLRE